jgi:radical SAM superfamily enzyme YgiQ (UPF0313 family)
MKLTLITPHLGRKSKTKYVRTWQMEALTIATLAALTPSDVEVEYFDERMEAIDFDQPTDLVAITVETYTAKRSYEICAEYRARGVKTILGGYHATLLPGEAEQYADSILIGYAEGIWEQVIRDASRGVLKRRYAQNREEPYEYVIPRREIFGDRKYLSMSSVETGRGCPLCCNFCSIAAATSSHYYPRSIDSVVMDVASIRHKTAFFVEDNFVGNPAHARELCREITPLKIKWMGQGTLTIAKDEKLLKAMAESGCLGVLIGFESLRSDTLGLMNKGFNVKLGNYKELIKKLHSYGIAIYGTFIFGYDSESIEDIRRTVDAALEFGIFIGAFNPLIPFPGTPLYDQFKKDGRLTDEAWWLSPSFRFGDAPFNPLNMTAAELHEGCITARKKFYSFPGILKRAKNVSGNCSSLSKAGGYFWLNNRLRKEVDDKDRLPLGNEPFRPQPRIVT